MKIKNLSKPMLLAMLSVTLAACSNSDTTTPTASASVAEENQAPANEASDTVEETNEKTTIEVEKPAEEEKEETAEASSNEDLQTANGSYVTTLLAAEGGERNPEFGYASAYDLNATADRLTVNGSFDYRENPEAGEDATELANDTYSFVINENTEFLSGGGLAEPTYYTVDEFNSFYQEVKESGLGLIIEVVDGVVKTVTVSS